MVNRWDNGPYSGAFKRVMTVSSKIVAVAVFHSSISKYSYLLSVPLIITYAVGFAVIKYKEGYAFLPSVGGES